MSAPSCLIFYGLRFDVPLDELAAIEERVDERVVQARKRRLDHYCGNFSNGENWYLFIGKKIANVGIEHTHSAQLAREELLRVFAETEEKLTNCGWSALPSLFIEYQPDH